MQGLCEQRRLAAWNHERVDTPPCVNAHSAKRTEAHSQLAHKTGRSSPYHLVGAALAMFVCARAWRTDQLPPAEGGRPE